VAPDRFRFDFSHPMAMTPEEIELVEDLVNEKIREDLPVRPRLMPYDEAQAIGAMALFGEKYGDTVRVVQIGGDGAAVADGLEPSLPFSRELCGGTHVSATGEIGHFHITGESSIGAGMRRIEAVTGRGAAALFRRYNATLAQVSAMLQTPGENVPERLSALLEELTAERRRAAALQRELWRKEAEALLDRSEVVNGSRVLAARVEAPNVDTMREMGDWLRDRLGSGIVVLGSVIADRPSFVVMVTPDLVKKGFHAGKIVKQIAAFVGGGGGGRPEMAQAGGKDKARLDQALQIVPRIVKGGESA
jgi:alanyl-tRNA synthetase